MYIVKASVNVLCSPTGIQYGMMKLSEHRVLTPVFFLVFTSPWHDSARLLQGMEKQLPPDEKHDKLRTGYDGLFFVGDPSITNAYNWGMVMYDVLTREPIARIDFEDVS